MDYLWDMPYIPRYEVFDSLQGDSQGAVNSEPKRLDIIDPSDSSSAESTDEEMIDDDTPESDSLRQAAQLTSSQEMAQHPGTQQMETREMATAKQNPPIQANADCPLSETRESLTRVNVTAPHKRSTPHQRSMLHIPEKSYDPDLQLEAKHLPRIKYEKSYTNAIMQWFPRIKSAKRRLKRKARPFTELEDTWEKYLQYAVCVLHDRCMSQDVYLKRQKLAMLTFASRITPRVLRIYAKNYRGSERDIFFDALDREIHSGSGLSDE